ncbi:MAG TPA: hypothetical protein PK095_01730 [Myxococcota bacterium]|nr:hypothetical protein [Myxococcota bacterium]
MWRFEIGHEWSGVGLDERLVVVVHEGGVSVEGPLFGEDTRPQGEGFCARLWEHEVVEVFLGRDDGGYVELEVGPFGHWLVLEFSGYRQGTAVHGVVNSHRVEVVSGRWFGELVMEPHWWREVLAGSTTGNAYAIHTSGGRRRYCAAFFATGGSPPDFHRRDVWRPLPPIAETNS